MGRMSSDQRGDVGSKRVRIVNAHGIKIGRVLPARSRMATDDAAAAKNEGVRCDQAPVSRRDLYSSFTTWTRFVIGSNFSYGAGDL